jgi:hypothetical protein
VGTDVPSLTMIFFKQICSFAIACPSLDMRLHDLAFVS